MKYRSKTKDRPMPEQESSIFRVVVLTMAVIASIGWGMLAGSYTGAHTKNLTELTDEERENVNLRMGRRGTIAKRSIATFVKNAFAQLPHASAVIGWHFSHRIWLPLTIVGLEISALAAGMGLMRLERQLDARSKRPLRKFNTPR